MVSGVACYSPRCTQPVIGQCAGYQERCGRFYCATHSGGTLCGEHAAQKAHDAELAAHKAEIDRLMTEYTAAAKSVKGRQPGCVGYIGYVALTLGMLVGTGYLSRGNPGLFLPILVGGIVLLFLSFIPYLVVKGRYIKRQVDQIMLTKPGFDEFWRVWARQQNAADKAARDAKSNAVLWGLVGAVVVGAGVAGGMKGGVQSRQLQRDVHDIADVAREIKRHG